MASTYYVNASSEGTAGNDSTGTGTAALPWLTLAKLLTIMANGDTAYLSGTFEENVSVTAAVNRSFLQWPLMPQGILRGDRTFNPSWTQDAATNAWYATLAGTNTAVSVTYKWDLHVDAFGRNYGHLTKATGADNAAKIVTVETTTNCWHQDTSANRLYVNIGGGAPASGTIRWCVGGGDAAGSTSGIRLANGGNNAVVGATGCRISGLHLYCFCDAASAGSYGLRCDGMSGTTLSDCVLKDPGWHGIGTRGSNVTNSFIDRCVVMGAFAPGVSPSLFVAHTDSSAATGVATNRVGLRIRDCQAWLYPVLGVDGTELALHAATAMDAFFTHGTTDGSNPTPINDLQYERCYAKVWPGTGAKTRYHARSADVPVPSSPLSGGSYGVRYSLCVWDGLGTSNHGAGSNSYYDRCKFDFLQCAAAGLAGTGCFTFGAGSAVNYLLMENCVALMNTDNAASLGVGMIFGQNNSINLVGCTFFEMGTDTSTGKQLFYYNSTTGVTVTAQNSILGYVSSGSGTNQYLCRNDGSNANADHVFSNCLYVNITTGEYSALAAIDTWAEWNAVIDTTGQRTAQLPLLNPARDGRLNHYGDGYLTQPVAVPKPGIYGGAFSGVRGADQDGVPAFPSRPNRVARC